MFRQDIIKVIFSYRFNFFIHQARLHLKAYVDILVQLLKNNFAAKATFFLM